MKKTLATLFSIFISSNVFATTQLSGHLTIIARPARYWGIITEGQFGSTIESKIFLKNNKGNMLFVGSLNQRDGEAITYNLKPGHYTVYASNLSFSQKDSYTSKKPTINTSNKIDINVAPNTKNYLTLNMAWHRHQFYFKQISAAQSTSLIKKFMPDIIDINFDTPPAVYYDSNDQKLLIHNILGTRALSDFQYAECQICPNNNDHCEKLSNCIYPYYNSTDFNNTLYSNGSAPSCPSHVAIPGEINLYSRPPVSCSIYIPRKN